jgi:hypothetical protein
MLTRRATDPGSRKKALALLDDPLAPAATKNAAD